MSQNKLKYEKRVEKTLKTAKTGIAEKIPYRNHVKIPHSYPLKGAVMYEILSQKDPYGGLTRRLLGLAAARTDAKWGPRNCLGIPKIVPGKPGMRNLILG